MKYDHMSKYDLATLARENVHWIGTLVCVAKDSPHSETLLAIAQYLADIQYSDFDEMAQEFK